MTTYYCICYGFLIEPNRAQVRQCRQITTHAGRTCYLSTETRFCFLFCFSIDTCLFQLNMLFVFQLNKKTKIQTVDQASSACSSLLRSYRKPKQIPCSRLQFSVNVFTAQHSKLRKRSIDFLFSKHQKLLKSVQLKFEMNTKLFDTSL